MCLKYIYDWTKKLAILIIFVPSTISIENANVRELNFNGTSVKYLDIALLLLA